MTTLTELINRASANVEVNISNDILADAAMQVKNDQRERLVSSVKGLIESFSADVKHNVGILREYRKQEEAQATRVKELNRAYHYFAATGNPLPMFFAQNGLKQVFNRKAEDWCSRAGITLPAWEDDAWKVPADFVAPAN